MKERLNIMTRLTVARETCDRRPYPDRCDTCPATNWPIRQPDLEAT